jgi:thiamine biosynthesis lipoprotein
MGGAVLVQLLDGADPRQLETAARRVLRRVGAWADRLTRFSPDSELSRLNASPLARVPVGPTLTSVLDWARTAETLTRGLVDVALLDERLEAELGVRPAGRIPATRRWSLERGSRRSFVRREPGVRLDLDGVAKGWLADRALELAPGRSALVDGDGDVALRVAPGDAWAIGIADPRDTAARLGVLELIAADGVTARFGVATSGVSVHRWVHRDGIAHHLIDPATGRPAATDVVQATALARTAREAEAHAKAAVILGSARAFATLDEPGILGLLLLTDRGEVRATPGLLRWLA